MADKRRKPYGVWTLLSDGPRMFCQEHTLDEAMLTARLVARAVSLGR